MSRRLLLFRTNAQPQYFTRLEVVRSFRSSTSPLASTPLSFNATPPHQRSRDARRRAYASRRRRPTCRRRCHHRLHRSTSLRPRRRRRRGQRQSATRFRTLRSKRLRSKVDVAPGKRTPIVCVGTIIFVSMRASRRAALMRRSILLKNMR